LNKVICPECGEINDIDNNFCRECNSSLIVNNQYYLLKILGENYGTTYKAINENKKFVLIKELSLRTLDLWKTEELFKREAKVLSQLNHISIPNFIENFSLGYGRNSRMYIVMEYIEGKSLEEERAERYYTEREILKLMKEILQVLNYIHSLTPPIIHRDLKPSNIMRRKNGDIVLIDFGSVRDIIKPKGGSTLIGTSGYMPPEQFMGKVSKKSDYYALAVTMVVMLSRKSPEDLYEGLEFKWQEHIDVSNGFYNLLYSMLEYHEEYRISSSEEIESTIDNILNNKNENIVKKTPQKIKDINIKPQKTIDNTEVFSLKEKVMDLIELAKDKKWTEIKYLLKTGSDVNILGKFNENLLFYSVDQNNIKYINYLLESKININNQNINGQTVLNFALQEKKYEIINILLDYRINFSLKDSNNKTALMFAATTNLEIFKTIFIKTPTNIVKQKDKKGDSVLFYAYNNKNYDIVKYLLYHNYDVNEKDRIGETILIKVSRIGNAFLLNDILKFNLEIEIKDLESETALFNAIKHKHYNIFKALVEYGANINTQDEFKWTPLMKAISYGEISIISYILENGGDISIKNSNNDNAINIAKYKENERIIELLRQYE